MAICEYPISLTKRIGVKYLHLLSGTHRTTRARTNLNLDLMIDLKVQIKEIYQNLMQSQDPLAKISETYTDLCLMFKARPNRTEVDPVRNGALINQPCSLINVIYCLLYRQISFLSALSAS